MKRRVLFVDHVSRILGGAEVNLVEFLGDSPDQRPPWDIAAACDPSGPLHEALASSGIERHAFAFDPALGQLRVVGRRFPVARAIRALRALRAARITLSNIVRDTRPHAVISCTNKDHFAAWPACQAAGIPSIWWVNDIVSPDFFPWSARRAFVSQARRGASRLVVVSEYARRALTSQGLPDSRIATIHNGIPVERYRGRPRGTLRRMLNLPDTEPIVGILGRFTPWKGQDLFVRIASNWAQSHPTGHFVLIGHAFNEDQAFEHSLRESVREQGLRERIHFIPFQRDVAAALTDLDLLVHASLKPEPFGRVIIEAMAASVPVIAARDGGVPEIITDGIDGCLATPGDPADYLRILNAVLPSPDLRSKLRDAASRRVNERFTLERVRSGFMALLDTTTP